MKKLLKNLFLFLLSFISVICFRGTVIAKDPYDLDLTPEQAYYYGILDENLKWNFSLFCFETYQKLKYAKQHKDELKVVEAFCDYVRRFPPIFQAAVGLLCTNGRTIFMNFTFIRRFFPKDFVRSNTRLRTWFITAMRVIPLTFDPIENAKRGLDVDRVTYINAEIKKNVFPSAKEEFKLPYYAGRRNWEIFTTNYEMLMKISDEITTMDERTSEKRIEQVSPETIRNSYLNPRNNAAPVKPSGDNAPVKPSGNNAPVKPSGNNAPVKPSGNNAPVKPSGNNALVKPSGNGSGNDDFDIMQLLKPSDDES